MSAGIEYLPLEDGGVGKLLCLYQESYPMLGWSERQLRWQYFDNPAGRAKVWLAKSGGRIVATCAAIPHRIVVRGATGLGWRVQDVITRPEFRGRGIYHHLSAMIRDELFDQQHAFNFTFPNDNTHNGFIRNGWTDLFRVPLHVMADIETVPYRESVTKVTPIQAFDEATDRVWESCRTRIDFAVDRSADYLQWRYFANPKGRYFPFRIERACNELVVVLKYYDHEGGSRWGHICDLFCAEDDARLVADAVDHAINFSRALGCGVITCWCQSGSSLAGALAAAGFALKENLDRWVVGNLNAAGYRRREFRGRDALAPRDGRQRRILRRRAEPSPYAMTCDFSLRHYRDILKTGIAQGYRFVGFGEIGDLPPDQAALVLRHDIDYMPEWSVLLGEIEHALGISATYFFQVCAKTYNLRETGNYAAVHALHGMGHTIGLHFDQTWKPGIRWEDVAALCAEDKQVFTAITGLKPCEIVSFHNPHRFRDLVVNRKVPGLRQTYEPAFFSEIKYLSDSQGWYEGCMCKIFGSRKYPKIQLLTHPYIWPETTTGEFIGDIANMIKLRSDELTDYLVEYHPVCRKYESRLRQCIADLHSREPR